MDLMWEKRRFPVDARRGIVGFVGAALPHRGVVAARAPARRRRVAVAQININRDEGLEARKDEIAAKIRKLRKKSSSASDNEKEEPATEAADPDPAVTEDGEEVAATARAKEIAAKIRDLKGPRSGAPNGTTAGPGAELAAPPAPPPTLGTDDPSPEAGAGVAGRPLRPPAEESAPAAGKVLSEEEVLLREMEDAEKFMTKGVSKYKPKVSTWGVFARPDNISRAYGGGKRIPEGGVDLDSEEVREKQARTEALLSEFKRASGVEDESEEQYREQIVHALEESDRLLAVGELRQAVALLEELAPLVSYRTELGGALHLQLAVTYEGLGLREPARELYGKLRKSPVHEISTRAKSLSFGYYAMDELAVGDTASAIPDWNLPDLDIKSRYDSTYLGERSRKKIGIPEQAESSGSTSEAVAIGFLVGVVSLIGVLAVSRSGG